MPYSDYLDLTQAARRTPGRPSPSTIWRWCRKGIKSRSGEQIRLDHVRAGSRIFIRPDAIDDFFRRVAEADAPHFDLDTEPVAVTKPRSSKRRHKSISDAKKVLAEARITK